ncbi:MAG: DUF2490 domain-containing protein [Bacteroidota bacterium]
MRQRRAFYLFILLMIASVPVMGQYQDLQLWSSVWIRADITPKLRVGLEEEARFFENISLLDKLNSDLTVDYEIFDRIRIGLLYRLITNREKEGDYTLKQRFGVSLGAEKLKGPWKLGAIVKFQTTYDEFYHSDDWYLPKNYFRVEGEISRLLNRNRTEPYATLEWWYFMPQGQQAFFDQYRLTLGVKHKLAKDHRINVYYRIQQEIRVKDPLFAHILGIGYLFTWRR